MNFEIFKRIIARQYNIMREHDETPYTLEEYCWVFEWYFYLYKCKFGKDHPNIKSEQVLAIMYEMPYYENSVTNCCEEIDAENYPDIMKAYFNTNFKDCDYNINHFFSGQIRELKIYEAGVK